VNAERFGDCWSGSDPRALTRFELNLMPMDLIVNWRRCSMTSDWIGRYIALEFPQEDHAFREISTVVNELLENLVKFAVNKRESVKLTVTNFGDFVRIDATNKCRDVHVQPLRDGFLKLLDSNPEELFLTRVEEAADADSSGSGLGLIALAKDHCSGLGLEVPAAGEGEFLVTVRAELSTEEMED